MGTRDKKRETQKKRKGNRFDENRQRRRRNEYQEGKDTKNALAKSDKGEKRRMNDHTENMETRSMADDQ